jgi:hypothetical protein
MPDLLVQHPPSKPLRESIAPAWITPELIALTIKTWQPRYTDQITREQAIGMLVNFGALIDVMEGRA